MSPRTFADVRSLVGYTAFGKRRLLEYEAADDVERLRATATKRWDPIRVSNEITLVKSVFKYADNWP